MKKKVTLKIPYELYLALKDMIKDTGLTSVNELVTFMLRIIAKGYKASKTGRLTSDDIERVKQRLRELGYID